MLEEEELLELRLSHKTGVTGPRAGRDSEGILKAKHVAAWSLEPFVAQAWGIASVDLNQWLHGPARNCSRDT